MELTPDLSRLPASTPHRFRAALEAASAGWCATLGPRLVSLVLFGSVARGDAHESSDIDLIVVAEGFPRSLSDRRQSLLETWDRLRHERSLPAVEWNLVTRSPEEARYHSPLYLDIVEDGVLVVDRNGFFGAVLCKMRTRMLELGSRRVFLADGSWYWDLKPDFRYGEVVEI